VTSEAEAIAAFRAARGGSANRDRTVRYRAGKAGRTALWWVAVYDEETDELYGGAQHYVGPDGQVWHFSSNPMSHRPDLVQRVLNRLYITGTVHDVDQLELGFRIQAISCALEESIDELVAAVGNGELRPR
jgi:hypothetical protein